MTHVTELQHDSQHYPALPRQCMHKWLFVKTTMHTEILVIIICSIIYSVSENFNFSFDPKFQLTTKYSKIEEMSCHVLVPATTHSPE